MNKLSILFIITNIFLLNNAYSWGKIGHRVVGEIASTHLSDLAKFQVKQILGNETLAYASVWPDRIKSDPKMRKKYSHLHYLNAPKGVNLSKRKKNSKGDILSAIDMFTKTLQKAKTSLNDKKVALRFLVHLIGDLHQPLHTGYGEDKGGNLVKVKWFGADTSLHLVWDEKIIQSEELSYTEYAHKLNHPSKKQIKSWQKSNPLIWANESREYVPRVYNFKEKKYWEFEYSYKHLGFLNQRLLQAGIRLAGHLNKILSN